MNWYKKSQLSNQHNRNVFPSDEDEAYFLGEDDPYEIREKKLERRRNDYMGVGNSFQRNKRWRKIYPHQEEIKKLEEQLKNHSIGEEERKMIKNRIGVHNRAIDSIFRGVGKPINTYF